VEIYRESTEGGKAFKSILAIMPALMYGVYSIPDNFLIDLSGIVIARNLRGRALENKLKELFAKPLLIETNGKN
jgi:hypothetical protein